jgi:single-strand DNA-binding protein
VYQQTIIIGNLGRDPEMRYFEDGTAVTNFSVATNRKWTDQATGDKKEETCWWRVSVFGRQAENCKEYLEKGSSVMVAGRMTPDPQTGSPRLWNRDDGTVGVSYELRAFDVRFLGKRDEGVGEHSDSSYQQQRQAAVEEDEIPF